MSALSLARNDLKESKTGWRASLQLQFSKKQNKTVPSDVKHFGPLRVQRPFYPESESICHTYILHPPGGVVGGDQLQTEIDVFNKAHSVITTPGACKIYRNIQNCKISNSIRLQDDAILEWMPHETIVFNDATCQLNSNINLSKTSRLFYWELVCFGLPAITQRFTEGHVQQNLIVKVDNKPIIVERNSIQGNSVLLKEKYGLQNFYVNGTLIMHKWSGFDIQMLREVFNDNDDVIAGVTEKADFIICRALCDDAEKIKKLFVKLWCIWREGKLNKKAVLPRIWKT